MRLSAAPAIARSSADFDLSSETKLCSKPLSPPPASEAISGDRPVSASTPLAQASIASGPANRYGSSELTSAIHHAALSWIFVPPRLVFVLPLSAAASVAIAL